MVEFMQQYDTEAKAYRALYKARCRCQSRRLGRGRRQVAASLRRHGLRAKVARKFIQGHDELEPRAAGGRQPE